MSLMSHLCRTGKKQHKDMAVVSMEKASDVDIQKWIDNVNELHRTKVIWNQGVYMIKQINELNTINIL